ncbi:MAG: hypothetical protein A2Z14_18385 [Chloroflexi bacterium RBG_16_48_8]|nr:MAG: hypothetical protein A2Z14_18385 [Chloroflexi bacterium RBG_16_48_8]
MELIENEGNPKEISQEPRDFLAQLNLLVEKFWGDSPDEYKKENTRSKDLNYKMLFLIGCMNKAEEGSQLGPRRLPDEVTSSLQSRYFSFEGIRMFLFR